MRRLVFLSLLVVPLLATAVPPPEPTHGQNEPCEVGVIPETPRTVRIKQRLVGSVEAIDGTIKLVLVEESCERAVQGVVSASRWTLVSRPAGSKSVVGVADGKARVRLDLAGEYVVDGVFCSGGCTVGTTKVEEFKRRYIISAVDELAPEMLPVVPRQKAVTSRHSGRGRCRDRAPSDNLLLNDAVDWFLEISTNQWKSVGPWRGKQDYERAEGWVSNVTISGTDNPLNHRAKDFEFDFAPLDPAFQGLLHEGRQSLGVELEYTYWPEEFRPKNGDRASIWGFHVNDCGHDYVTEIHPPVGIAVHRATAVAIPESAMHDFDANATTPPESAGKDVVVPGIITNVWIHKRAGKILHPSRHAMNGGIPGGVAPIDRKFSFSIALPRAPDVLYSDYLRQLGRSAPTVPLYFRAVKMTRTRAGAPEPKITPMGGALDGRPFLQVDIDLEHYTQEDYAYQIEAAWVLPSEDNWGLEAFKPKLRELRVKDDADPIGNGSGEWRLWLVANGGSREWLSIVNHASVKTGTYAPGKPIFQNSDVAVDGNLPTVIRRFAGQLVGLRAIGIEDDFRRSEELDAPDASHAPFQFTSEALEGFAPRVTIDSGYYRLDLELVRQTVPRATLSPGAKKLYAAYSKLSETYSKLSKGLGDRVVATAPAVAAPPEPPAVAPRLVQRRDHTEVARAAAIAKTKNPANAELFMKAVREFICEVLAEEEGRARAARELAALKRTIPPDLWSKYLADLERGGGCAPAAPRPR